MATLGYGRRSKYNNTRIEYDGKKFDSLFEYEQYKVLKLLEHRGKIRDLECQPKVYLTDARILYKPDFKYWDNDVGKWVYVDIKGYETDVFRIKMRLWKAYGPGELQVWKRGAKKIGGVKVTAIVQGVDGCSSKKST